MGGFSNCYSFASSFVSSDVGEIFFSRTDDDCWDCSVSQSCPDGPSVSCSGASCSKGPDWVQCDGVRTYCETACTGDGDFCLSSSDCECSCGPPDPECIRNRCQCLE